jgi:anti-sigma regulatory factor (Ser/Thr protein kinase)
MDGHETSLPPSSTAPQAAREFLRDALATQNLDGLGDVTELLTTELVANVIDHVGSEIRLRVYAQADLLRVEVDDTSTVAPAVKQPDPMTPGGNGMLIVDALATRWGVEKRPEGGKTVWFELDTPTATEEVHGSPDA